MSGRVILVTAVGEASGSRAAAAALACAGSEPDRPGLLIDVGGRPPRPTLVASAGARELEERLAVHLPELRAASRGRTCHLAVAGRAEDFERCRRRCRSSATRSRSSTCRRPVQDGACGARASGPAASCSAPISPRTVRSSPSRSAICASAACARVLKRPLAWVPARRALFGVLPPGAPGGLPSTLLETLLESEISAAHGCYAGLDDAETDPEGAAQQQRRGDAGAGRGRGLHRDSQWQAGR